LATQTLARPVDEVRHLPSGWLALAAAFDIYRIVPFLPEGVNGFAASNFLYSYSAGVHKRALVGSVLEWLGGSLSGVSLYELSLAMLGLFALALVLFTARVMLASRASFVLLLALIGGPAILPHFAYALGYFDPLLVVDALLIATLITSALPAALSVALAAVLCAAGSLIHESFLMTALPLVVIVQLARGASQWRRLLPLVAVAVLVPVAVQFAGHPSLPLDQYVARAATRTDIHLSREAFELLYFSPQENLRYLVQHYASASTDLRLLTAFVLPLPYFLCLYDIYRVAATARPVDMRTQRVVAISILIPMALLLVGFDALRWVGFACVNCAIFVHECLRADASGAVERACERYVRSPRFVLLALWSFSLGSLHVVDSNGFGSGVHSLGRGLGLFT
jgi:hypothetical protein